MSNILRIDSVGGASGDMMLGALHDLGVSLDEIQAAVSSLDVDPFFLSCEDVNEKGISAKRVTVHVDADLGEHHGHSHHRHLPDIERIIDSGSLHPRVKEMAKTVFSRLADAEASINGISLNKVHFH